MDPKLGEGMMDEERLRLSKQDLKKNEIVKFECQHVKAIYTSMISQGKIGIVIEDPDNQQRQVKVLVHDANPDMLKRFCSMLDTLVKDRKAKQDEAGKKSEEYYTKRREVKMQIK